MKSICKIFSKMSVIFCDESNKLIDDWLLWCYSNYPLITRSKALLDFSEFLVRGFWSWFCKLALFDTPNGRSKCVLEFFLAQTKQDHGPLTPIVTNNNNCKVWCFGLEFSNFGWKYTDFVAYVAPLTARVNLYMARTKVYVYTLIKNLWIWSQVSQKQN
jgi:hypothetical protein